MPRGTLRKAYTTRTSACPQRCSCPHPEGPGRLGGRCSMNVTVLGAGYVGLSTGVTFAFLGHDVTCLDVDRDRVEALRAGRVPFYEPQLDEMLAAAGDRLRFVSDYAEAIPHADVIFIAVGTPAGVDGAADLRFLAAAATSIGEN